MLIAVRNSPCDLERNVYCPADQAKQENDLFKRHGESPPFAFGVRGSGTARENRPARRLDTGRGSRLRFGHSAFLSTRYHNLRENTRKRPHSFCAVRPFRLWGTPSVTALPCQLPLGGSLGVTVSCESLPPRGRWHRVSDDGGSYFISFLSLSHAPNTSYLVT